MTIIVQGLLDGPLVTRGLGGVAATVSYPDPFAATAGSIINPFGAIVTAGLVPLATNYTAEDGTSVYTTEDGSANYISGSGGTIKVPYPLFATASAAVNPFGANTYRKG